MNNSKKWIFGKYTQVNTLYTWDILSFNFILPCLSYLRAKK
ncbi:hypothetical protein FDUTEX481_09474 [Tolypothrix sp. PCC 7601]|nr:hypothetical protein FDUTEX481_09474 [Tolypothrix sp. PCC 7601]